MKLLLDFHWPGNVRELENIIERGVTLSAGSTLDAADIHLDPPSPRAVAGAPSVLPLGMTLDQWEDEAIREALKQANGNKSQAARTLGFRATLSAIASRKSASQIRLKKNSHQRSQYPTGRKPPASRDKHHRQSSYLDTDPPPRN